jgi:rhamnosyltransferase
MRSKNEMPHIRAALEGLARQTFRDWELFAVDSGSNDGSVHLLREYCDAAHLTEIRPGDYAPGRVLNHAISATDSPLLVLLNADAIPLSDRWLEELLRPIIEGRADAAFSRQVARPDARFIVAYDYRRAYDPGNEEAGFFSAVACAFKRELWEKQPFRTSGYAEDARWAAACRKAGARITLTPDSAVEHSHNYTLNALFHKRRRQAATSTDAPRLDRRILLCGRELARDLLYAARRFKLHTVPYNMAYRIAIHAGIHRGLKEAPHE